MHQSEIFHLEFRGKFPLTLVYQLFITYKKQVIYIWNKYQDTIMNNFKVQVRINCTFGKPQAVENSINPGILDSRSLLSTYKDFFSLHTWVLFP